ncbi:MAG TPA: hypothetical protein VGY99_10800 [Candidatus Binataceae bacterium]|nr:hypothetical protein [Candidatus Binataceae bacterium]
MMALLALLGKLRFEEGQALAEFRNGFHPADFRPHSAQVSEDLAVLVFKANVHPAFESSNPLFQTIKPCFDLRQALFHVF